MLLQNLQYHLLVMHQSKHQLKCHLDKTEMTEDNKGCNEREEDKQGKRGKEKQRVKSTLHVWKEQKDRRRGGGEDD